MIQYIAIALFILLCCINIWLIIYFLKSGGKNPPFIASFGKPKLETIKQADLFLQKNPKAKTVDLGCGSGSILIPLAKKHPKHHFVGYEWDIIPFMIARYKTRKLPNTTILYKDFFKENLNQFQLVLCYLGTSIEEKVGKKLNKELSPDSLIISEIFKLSVLNLKKEINVQWGIIKTKIYLYTPTINAPTKK